MIRRFSAVLVAMLLSIAAVLGFSSVASAHSDEFLSVPANGAVVSEVSQLQFTFVEPVEQSFPPEVVLTASDGTGFELGAPTFDATGATMTVPIVQGALPNGSYTAVYRIVSIDGHPASVRLISRSRVLLLNPHRLKPPCPLRSQWSPKTCCAPHRFKILLQLKYN